MKTLFRSLIAVSAVLAPALAFAHPGDAAAHGFLAGVVHPWTGIDHIIAMLAAGLWASRLGGRAIPSLLCASVLGIAIGAVLGVQHSALTLVEQMTATSAVVLGLLVASASTPRVSIAAALVALFCLFHGYAHAVDTPEQFWQPAFTGGFILSMLVLQLIGAASATLLSRQKTVLRSAGACCAVAGVVALFLVA